MSDIKQAVTNSQSITITLDALANNGVATSSAIDNSSDKFLSAIVQVTLKAPASGTVAYGFANVYLARSADGGTTYDCNSTSPTTKAGGAQLLGMIPLVTNNEVVIGSFDTALLGALGSHWKILVENKTGGVLPTGGHGAQFAGVYQTVA